MIEMLYMYILERKIYIRTITKVGTADKLRY